MLYQDTIQREHWLTYKALSKDVLEKWKKIALNKLITQPDNAYSA